MTPNSTSPKEAAPVGRRTFFQWLTIALGAATGVLASIPLVGYFLRNRARAVHWVPLGAVADYTANETRRVTFDNPLRQPWDGMTAETAVFVRFEGMDSSQQPQFRVLAQNCAHLGCPVSWFPQSGLFMCPCHGGVYYADGERASGPPPRGLFHCVWRVRDGQIEIQAPHYPTLQDTMETPA